VRLATVLGNFWKKVQRTDGCWLWTASTCSSGYGTFGAGERTYAAHRLSYQMHFGEIPKGRVVMHTCDVPACVNPAHLRIGSQAENVRDSASKGRHQNPVLFGEQHPGSKLSWADVVAMREAYSEGISIYRLAKQYQVAWATAKEAVTGVTWNKAS
jgi:hypothetical protein